jgi:hypothetical protein
MQRREKILAVILLLAILVWWGRPFVWRTAIEPVEIRQAELDMLTASIAEKQVEQVRLARARRQLEDCKSRSLSRDPLVAHRVYQGWLTDLAQNAGFEELKVTPERRVSRDEGYTTVDVSISAEATLGQLCLFLHRFYRTDLLHRVTNISLQSKANNADPVLKVSLTAEGLCMADASPRKRMFAESRLREPCGVDDTLLAVRDAVEFPEDGNYLVRIGSEYLRVTRVSGNEWTVQRGVDASLPAEHAEGAIAAIVPIRPDTQLQTMAACRALIGRNPFAVPSPDLESPQPDGVAGEEKPPLDAAEFAFLIGVITRDDQRKALFFDRLNNQRISVTEGESFSMAGIEAAVVQIGADHIVLRRGGRMWRLPVGENLRSMRRSDDAEDDGKKVEGSEKGDRQ